MSTRYTVESVATRLEQEIVRARGFNTKQRKYPITLRPDVPPEFRDKVIQAVYERTGSVINWDHHPRVGDIIVVRLEDERN